MAINAARRNKNIVLEGIFSRLEDDDDDDDGDGGGDDDDVSMNFSH